MKRKPQTFTAAALCTSLLTVLVLSTVNGADQPRAAAAPAAKAAPAPDARVDVGLHVHPPDVHLATSRDTQGIVVTYTEPSGITRDVTAQSKFTFTNQGLANLKGREIHPVADGATDLVVEYQGQKVNVPVTVKDAKIDREISFKLDVMPVFLRAGCNTGGCHGSARGKDGFNLSLFGYDPDGDYTRITRQQPGRRINLGFPEDSLLLTKSTGAANHTGGTLFKSDSHLYTRVLRWLEAGAPKDPSTVAEPVSLELLPKNAVLEEGDKMQFTARARYSDGTDRDVTDLVLISSNNPGSAATTPDGLVSGGKRGEAFIMARFDNAHRRRASVIVDAEGPASTPAPNGHRVQLRRPTFVGAKLNKIRIAAQSAFCTDEQCSSAASTIDLDWPVADPRRRVCRSSPPNADPEKRDQAGRPNCSERRKEFVRDCGR